MLSGLKTALLDRFGLEVQRRATLAHFLRTREIDLVVDVGANLGQFAQSVRSKGYHGRIHSFEPVGATFAALKPLADRDGQWTVQQTALGSAPGSAEINVLDNHALSSMLTPTDLMGRYDTGGGKRTETVAIETLDRVLAQDPARNVFLKIDVQGLEKQVLEGARETLGRTVALYVELPIHPLYEGMWTFVEAIQHIDALGFEPAQFRMVNSLPDDPASAVEFDSLFRRKA